MKRKSQIKSRKVWAFNPVTRTVPSAKRYRRKKINKQLLKSLMD